MTRDCAHSPFGSGPAPIVPRDEILRLQQEEEAALLRAEMAMRRLRFFSEELADDALHGVRG